MRLPVWLTVFLLCVSTLSAAPGFRFYWVPPAFFTAEETAAFPDDGQVDVMALMKKRGLKLPGGSVASYDAVEERLYLKAEKADLNLLDRLLEDTLVSEVAVSETYGTKQVRIMSVCYAIPVSAVPADFKATSLIKELDAKSLKVIDRRSLLIRSGQRSKSESRIPGPAKPPEEEPSPPRDLRSLEAEVTVGEDGDSIDMNLALDLRIPDLAPEKAIGEFTLATQALLHNGGRLMHELGVTSEKEPRLVLWEISVTLESASRAVKK